MGLFFNKNEGMSDGEVMERQEQSQKSVNVLDNSFNPNSEMIDRRFREEKEDLVRWQQDLELEIDNFVHDLKREVLNDKGEWVKIIEWRYNEKGKPVEVEVEPMCNDIGIQMIKTIARPFMSKNEMMSNYSEERILQKLKSALMTLVRNLGMQLEYYECSFHDISLIRVTTQNFIMSAPFRALNNGERKHLQSSTRRVETVNDIGSLRSSKKSFMGIFGS